MGGKRKANTDLNQHNKMKKQKKKVEESKYSEVFENVEIEGDGNCLSRAILFCLERNDAEHFQLRKEVCDYMQKNKGRFVSLVDIKAHKGVRNWEDYIKKMRKDGTCGDHCEIVAASELKKFNFSLYEPEKIQPIIVNYSNPTYQMIHLEYKNGNHYNSLMPIVKTTINLSKDDKNKTEYQEEKKSNRLQTKGEIDSDVDENSKKKVQGLKKNQAQEKKQDSLILKMPEARDLYSKAKGHSDAYNEAYQYLKYGLRPKRIVNDLSFKNWTKEITRRYELKNRAPAKYSQSRLVLKNKVKKENEEKNQIIPYKDEIPKIIEQAHNGFTSQKIKHNGLNMTIRNINEMSIYWANLKSDVKDYIKNCVDCVANESIQPIKILKTILADGPLDRITADCWEIPKEMRAASDNRYNYVLTCVDHFSKYKWTELLSNKNAEIMVTKLEYVFNYFGNPKKFQTDNGKEFVNEAVSTLCKSRNIEFLHGRPYHPQSQGVVEKVNDFVAQSLKLSYADFMKQKKIKIWDIESALKAFTANANKNVHSVTLKVPNKLVLCNDTKEIEEVKKRIASYYDSKTQKKVTKLPLKVGTKVYIVKKVFKVKNKQKLVSKPQKIKSSMEKNYKTRIPCIIEDISELENHHVKVRIAGKQSEDMVLNQIYRICISNLEIAKNEKSWHLLVIS